MIHKEIQNLYVSGGNGSAPVELQARITLGRAKIYGVGIAADSEIDQCAISLRGGGATPGLHGAFHHPGTTYNAGELGDVLKLATGGVSKVGVGAPWIGEMTHEVIVYPSVPNFRPFAGKRAPVLTLDLAESPLEAIALASRTRRAPLAAHYQIATGTGHDGQLWIPLYGRAWWSLAFKWDNVTGTDTKAWNLYGYTSIATTTNAAAGPDGITAIDTGIIASGSSTGDIAESIESDSGYDLLLLTAEQTGSSSTARLAVVVRAEDA